MFYANVFMKFITTFVYLVLFYFIFLYYANASSIAVIITYYLLKQLSIWFNYYSTAIFVYFIREFTITDVLILSIN